MDERWSFRTAQGRVSRTRSIAISKGDKILIITRAKKVLMPYFSSYKFWSNPIGSDSNPKQMKQFIRNLRCNTSCCSYIKLIWMQYSKKAYRHTSRACRRSDRLHLWKLSSMGNPQKNCWHSLFRPFLHSCHWW